jgi:hypothetical protein
MTAFEWIGLGLAAAFGIIIVVIFWKISTPLEQRKH